MNTYCRQKNFMNNGIRLCPAGLVLNVLILLVAVIFAIPTHGTGQVKQDRKKLLAPYVPSPNEVVDKMLELAQVDSNDVVYDLGCGDGRIVITAAKRFGSRGVGVELDKGLAEIAESSARTQKVEHLVTILNRDVMTVDFSEATVIAVYLLPGALKKLKPIFEKSLKPGTRIVSHDYTIEGWNPDDIGFTASSEPDDYGRHAIFLWTIKEKE